MRMQNIYTLKIDFSWFHNDLHFKTINNFIFIALLSIFICCDNLALILLVRTIFFYHVLDTSQ